MKAKVLVGSNCGILGRHLSKKFKASNIEVKRFPDNEIYIRVPENVKNKKVFYIQSFYPHQNSSLIESIFTINTLFDLGAKRVSLIAPYLPYARQDKRHNYGEAMSSFHIFNLFKNLGVRDIITVNSHTFKKEGLYDVNGLSLRNENALPLIKDFIKRKYGEDVLVALPDKGARNLMVHDDAVWFDKKRYDVFSGKTRVSLARSKDVEKRTILLLDDMISTGSTIIEAYKRLVRMKAKRVIVSCVHGLFVGDCIKRFKSAGVNNVVSTDTIDSRFSKVSVSPIIEKYVSKA